VKKHSRVRKVKRKKREGGRERERERERKKCVRLCVWERAQARTRWRETECALACASERVKESASERTLQIEAKK